ncbi:hypothetical protein RQP54_09950 [Curvibacter sp. APW13]|uniref:hypothetical protein n=1 Tax=Curvibacter sp. APW13 TaxID=3077236 RepID=UPI0028DFECE9|nr:hypothetical protein [Curvibacter sp. APW13]MDT8991186.1 hypothetical protein [Curvibacter sp. APW13]
MTLDTAASAYVQLVLAVGQHDPGYVDAYYGPEALLPTGSAQPLEALLGQAQRLHSELLALALSGAERLRWQFLHKHVASVAVYIRKLQGERLPFDQESLGLYDAVSPPVDEARLDAVLDGLGALLPGSGDVPERMVAYNRRFQIPVQRLDAVFSAAIAEARQRTAQHIALPPGESFRVEYVTNQVWSAYNWFQGRGHSLIQVNTDLPMGISRAIDLAAHEGYPGHHVFHLLGEHHLVQGKGWLEYSVFPLYSPMALLSEGAANHGIEVVFPAEERLAFEQAVLFPLAGLDSAEAPQYYRVQAVVQQLSYAGNMVAQRFLDGEIDAAQAVALLMRYCLYDEARARQRLRFIEHNRAYVINYNLGQDLVRRYLHRVAPAQDSAAQWVALTDLLLQPRTASMLQEDTA